MPTAFDDLLVDEPVANANAFDDLLMDEPPKEKSFFGLGDTASALAEIPSELYQGIPIAFRRMRLGLQDPSSYSPEDAAAFEAESQRQAVLQQEQEAREARGENTSVGDAFRGAVRSLPFSVSTMVPSIAAGAGTGAAVGAVFPPAELATVPIGAIAGTIGGMMAGGTAAYRMAGQQFLDDSIRGLQDKAKSEGKTLSKEELDNAYEVLLPIAENTGLWEAGPEAVGNAVTAGAGKFIFGFGKDLAADVVKRTLGKKIAAAVGATGVEVGGETITAMNQGPDQAKAQQFIETGSTEGALDEYQGLEGFGKALEEVGPTVLATQALFGGTGGGVKLGEMGLKKLIGKQNTQDPFNPEAPITEDDTSAEDLTLDEATALEPPAPVIPAPEDAGQEQESTQMDQVIADDDPISLQKQWQSLEDRAIRAIEFGATERLPAIRYEQARIARKITGETKSPEEVEKRQEAEIKEAANQKIDATAPVITQELVANESPLTAVAMNRALNDSNDAAEVQKAREAEVEAAKIIQAAQEQAATETQTQETPPNEESILLPQANDETQADGIQATDVQGQEEVIPESQVAEELNPFESPLPETITANVPTATSPTDSPRTQDPFEDAPTQGEEVSTQREETVTASGGTVAPASQQEVETSKTSLTESQDGDTGVGMERDTTKPELGEFYAVKPTPGKTPGILGGGGEYIKPDGYDEAAKIYADGMGGKVSVAELQGIDRATRVGMSPALAARHSMDSTRLHRQVSKEIKDAIDDGVFESGKPARDYYESNYVERYKSILDGYAGERIPLLASDVKDYGITLPEGYKKQGDLYVYSPESKQQPSPTIPAKEQVDESPDEVTSKTSLTETQVGDTGVGMERDTTKPDFKPKEQQSPDEYLADFSYDIALARAEMRDASGKTLKALQKEGKKAYDKRTSENLRQSHVDAISIAAGMDEESNADFAKYGMEPPRNPVSSAAVDAYKIELPDGYKKQGDLYVYSPESKQQPSPTIPAKEQVDDTGVGMEPVSAIEREAAAIGDMQAKQKERSSIYNAGAKDDAAELIGIKADRLYDLPYEKWSDVDRAVQAFRQEAQDAWTGSDQTYFSEIWKLYAQANPDKVAKVRDSVESILSNTQETWERDTTKPEQMEPEEVNLLWGKAKKWAETPDAEIARKYQAEFSASDAYMKANPFAPENWREGQRKLLKGKAPQKQHESAIERATKETLPVSKAAVDAYGITLPEGYVQDGELYVYRPSGTVEAEPAPPAKPAVEVGTGVAGVLTRGKPRESIVFKKPVSTPLGDVIGYSWSSQLVEDVDKMGEPVLRRISNWEEAANNAETGRDIVHRFLIKKPDGTTSEVSLESTFGKMTDSDKKTIKSVVAAAKKLPFMRAELAELQDLQKQAEADYQRTQKLTPDPTKLELREPDAKWLSDKGSKGAYLEGVFLGYVESSGLNAKGELANKAKFIFDNAWKWRDAKRTVRVTDTQKDRAKSLARSIKKAEDLLSRENVEVAKVTTGEQPTSLAETGPPVREMKTPSVTTDQPAPISTRPSLGSTGKQIVSEWRSLQGTKVAPGETVVGWDVNGGGTYAFINDKLVKLKRDNKGFESTYADATDADWQAVSDALDRGALQVEVRKITGLGNHPKVDAGKTVKVLHQATGKPLQEFLDTPEGAAYEARMQKAVVERGPKEFGSTNTVVTNGTVTLASWRKRIGKILGDEYRKSGDPSRIEWLDEARDLWKTEKEYRYNKLIQLRDNIGLMIQTKLDIPRNAADKMAEALIEGRPNLIERIANLEPVKQSEIVNLGGVPSSFLQFGYERGERGVYTHPKAESKQQPSPTIPAKEQVDEGRGTISPKSSPKTPKQGRPTVAKVDVAESPKTDTKSTEQKNQASDPIGYGESLIDLFPSIRNQGVTVISMEEAMVRLDAEWDRKVKSGKATKIDQLVYMANKKSTQAAIDGSRAGGSNIGGRWSRTDKTIAVATNATPSAMAHELGHAIMELEYANASQETKNAITEEYNQWFAAKYGKGGVPSVADQRRIWEWMKESDWLDPSAPFPQDQRVASWENYRSSFDEWFADEVAKWATVRTEPRSLIGKFFSELSAKLEKLWNKVSVHFSPSTTLASWLDSISKPSPSKQDSKSTEQKRLEAQLEKVEADILDAEADGDERGADGLRAAKLRIERQLEELTQSIPASTIKQGDTIRFKQEGQTLSGTYVGPVNQSGKQVYEVQVAGEPRSRRVTAQSINDNNESKLEGTKFSRINNEQGTRLNGPEANIGNNKRGENETNGASVRGNISPQEGGEDSLGLSPGDNSERANAIRNAVSGIDWKNATAAERIKALADFSSRVASGFVQLPASSNVSVTITRKEGERIGAGVVGTPNGKLLVEINTGPDTKNSNTHEWDNPEAAFAYAYDVMQEESIHALQHAIAFRRWKAVGSPGKFEKFSNQKQVDSLLEVLRQYSSFVKSGDVAAAQKIQRALLDSWNLYRDLNNPVNSINELVDLFMKDERVAVELMPELTRQLVQLTRQDFTTETGWKKFFNQVQEWMRNAVNSLKAVLPLARNGDLGPIIQQDIKELESMMRDYRDGKPMAKYSRQRTTRPKTQGLERKVAEEHLKKLGVPSSKVYIIDEPSIQIKGRYDPDGGIALNIAYLDSVEEINDTLMNHEAIHDAVETDKKVKQRAIELLDALTDDEMSIINEQIRGYSENEKQDERIVEAVRLMTSRRPDLRTKWARFVEAVSLAIKKFLGIKNLDRQVAELVAARILARGESRVLKGKMGGRDKFSGNMYSLPTQVESDNLPDKDLIRGYAEARASRAAKEVEFEDDIDKQQMFGQQIGPERIKQKMQEAEAAAQEVFNGSTVPLTNEGLKQWMKTMDDFSVNNPESVNRVVELRNKSNSMAPTALQTELGIYTERMANATNDPTLFKTFINEVNDLVAVVGGVSDSARALVARRWSPLTERWGAAAKTLAEVKKNGPPDVDTTSDESANAANQEMTDALDEKRRALLEQDSKALAKLLSQVKGDVKWSDFFTNNSRISQKERQRRIYTQILKHDNLRNLSQAERLQLTRELDKAWARARKKVFLREFSKKIPLKNPKLKKKLEAQAPALLKAINLGTFDSQAYRKEIAKTYGLKDLSDADLVKVIKLGSEIQDTDPLSRERRKKIMQLARVISGVTNIPLSHIVSAYYISSILASGRTGMGAAFSIVEVIMESIIGATVAGTRSPTQAMAGLNAAFKAFPRGLIEGLSHFWTGDKTGTLLASDAFNQFLGGEGYSPVSLGELLWKEKNPIKKFAGAVIVASERLLTGVDLTLSSTMHEASLIWANTATDFLDENGNKISIRNPTAADKAKMMDQVIAEEFGGVKPPMTPANLATINAAMRDQTERFYINEDPQNGTELVKTARRMASGPSFQGEVRGFMGEVVDRVNALFSDAGPKFEKWAEKNNVTGAKRDFLALFVGLSALGKAFAGMSFFGFVGRLINRNLQFVPGTALIPEIVLGTNPTQYEKKAMFAKNAVGFGLIILALQYILSDDDDDDNMFGLEGSGDTLSGDQRNAKRTTKALPNSIWYRDANGDKIYLSFANSSLSWVISAMANLREQKVNNPEKWAEATTEAKLAGGMFEAGKSILSTSAMGRLGELLGGGRAYSTGGVGAGVEGMASKIASFGGGFVPSVIREIDYLLDPNYYEPRTLAERAVSVIPFLRRQVADGQGSMGVFGSNAQINRSPTSRIYSSGADTEAEKILSKMQDEGLYLPLPDDKKGQDIVSMTGRKIVMTPEQTRRYVQLTGEDYQRWILREGESIIAMPRDKAKKRITEMAGIIKKRAAKMALGSRE